ncbi:endonuclease/exonuclease/phosphatase family protein [Photobacterium profundum]|uniref:endonuclease/exonuclease/phosphatase family protein n=1 Tax=Photobacterium profundum TaxID=74109 RepID=UPI003D138820
MRWRLPFFLICTWALVNGSFAKPNVPPLTTTLTVASWNLQWLASDPIIIIPPPPQRTRADYQQLAHIATQLDTDILAFQEVADRQAIEKVLTNDEYVFEFSRRQQESQHNNKRHTKPWPQFVGFAIRKGISYVRNADLHQLDLRGNKSLRYGVDITLLNDGKAALRLLTVHLKSGCYSQQQSTKNRACRQLNRQFEVLEQWVDRRAAEPLPFMILGDFNRRLTLHNDQMWQQLDDGRPTGLSLYAATEGQKSQCRIRIHSKHKKHRKIRHYPNFIDHIVLDERAKQKMVNNSFRELTSDVEVVKAFNLSDHCPIALSLSL